MAKQVVDSLMCLEWQPLMWYKDQRDLHSSGKKEPLDAKPSVSEIRSRHILYNLPTGNACLWWKRKQLHINVPLLKISQFRQAGLSIVQ